MNRKPVNILNLILFFDSLLFVVLYSILSSNARLASDDFYYIWLKNTFGPWGGMVYQYENWSGRWTAHSFACGLLSFWEYRSFLPIINLGTFAALYLSIRFGLQKILKHINAPTNGILLPGLSIMLITSFFFATYSIGESWFWYIIEITYLWSLIAFLALLNFLYSVKKNTAWVLVVPAALFIGGASESFALFFMLILAVIILSERNQIPVPGKEIVRKSAIILTLIFISFLFSFLAPGTGVRRALLPHTSLLFKGWSYIKTIAKFFIIYFPRHAGYLFLFSFPWLLFGNNYLKGKFTREEKILFAKKVTRIFIAGVLISLVPTVYVMSEAGPDRAMLVISLMTAVYAAIIFAIAGTMLQSSRSFRIMSALIGDVSILTLLIIVYVQSQVTGSFSDAYDTRMENLYNQKIKNTKGIVVVPPLPDPGMLYWEELSDDTTYFTNQHLQKGLGLPYGVISKHK